MALLEINESFVHADCWSHTNQFCFPSYHLAQLCADFGVKPSEVLLIDDCERNCIRAEKAGFRALTIDEDMGFSLQRIRPPRSKFF